MARAAERRLGDFIPQGLANLAWAFVKVSHPDAQFFKALARAAQRAVGDFGPQERERVMELLLSQERVVTLLYERTFPDRPHELLPAESAELREGEELGIDDPGL